MASATEISMCYDRSALEKCIPLPRTSLTAVNANIVDFQANNLDGLSLKFPPLVIVYFQDTHGHVCATTFCYPTDRSGRKNHEYNGEEPRRVPGRTLALFSPLNIVQWRKMPFAYYLDNIGVIIEASVNQGPNGTNVQDLEWIDIKAANWSRLGALTEEERGTWVYYESGREKGIREIWKGVQPNSNRPRYNFSTFKIPRLLNGTDIAAVQIPSMQSGSFFYQHEDFSLWEHNWDNKEFQWKIYQVLPGHPSDPAHEASPLTSLAAAFNPGTNTIYVHYLNANNQLGIITRVADTTTWTAPTIFETERIIPGSRLGACNVDKYGNLVAFQVDRADLHGMFYYL